MSEFGHFPVLSKEVIDLLNPKKEEVLVDLTAGRGGHSYELAKLAGKKTTVVLFDLDELNLKYASDRVKKLGVTVIPIHSNFTGVASELEKLSLKADCVLADLGFASNQMDNPARGLSFMEDGPLDMRLDHSSGETAADLLKSSSEKDIADIIYQFGEEPFSRRIARKIVHEREKEPILTTVHLAQIVREAYGPRARTSRMNPATRTFMALRIAVNGELAALDALLAEIKMGCRKVTVGGWLNHGARIAVISFHSLEDRRVKQSFVALEKDGLATRLTRKPLRASEEEIALNTRSRSAKLRAVELL
ncbi:MAG: 16S rRNA (cytosine(1402)-N(4))-methyltransferase RsmH [Phycisphaerales bacterium]|jgi:16S rRNA (cytosine1402-N4)-methyltransferase|nr:16S rRNA (cytosine(1402)-N(4))-methyltransferase RsmH [Phycisphaerales bacterium]